MLNASEIYASLSPELATLDVERKRIWRILLPVNILFFTFLIAGVAAIYWLLSNQQDNTLDWFVPTFGGVAFVSFITWSVTRFYFKKKIKTLFIDKIVPKIVSNLGEDFTYDYDKEISSLEVRDCLLFPDFNNFKSEDLIRGTIDDVTLKFAEVKLVEEKSKSSGSGRTYTTIFQGIYFNASIAVTFPTSVWIVTSEFDDKLKERNVAQLNLDDNPIPKYKYFGEDVDMAKAILKPYILDKINELNQRLKSEGVARKPLIYRFHRNRVQIGIWTKYGLFEPKISQSINSQKFIEKQTSVLNAITGLLKDLTLK